MKLNVQQVSIEPGADRVEAPPGSSPASSFSARWSVFFGLLTGLLGLLALQTQVLGPVATRAFLTILWGSWVFLARRQFGDRRRVLIALLGAVVGVAVLRNGETERVLCIGGALVLLSISTAWKSGGVAAKSLGFASACTAWFSLAAALNPALDGLVHSVALAWSSTFGAFFGVDVSLGARPLGVPLMLPLAALVVGRFLLHERRTRTVVGLLAILAASTFVPILLLEPAASWLDTSSLWLLAWPGVVVLAMPLTAWIVTRPVGVPSTAMERAPVLVVGGGFAAAGCGLWVTGLFGHMVEAKQHPRIGFYDPSEPAVILNYDRPAYGNYGPYSLGMFGLLPEVLAADGYEVEFYSDLPDSGSFEGLDLFVVINADTMWSEDDLVAVWEYVDAGGTLAVFGDHTGAQGTFHPQNDLLAPSGIALRFDSAYPTARHGWARAQVFSQQALPTRIGPGAFGVAIGAGLDLAGWGPLPLLVGRQALSDWGNLEAEEYGYLGDYAYDPGEEYGGQVLAAWARLGAGRIVAFGDTSPLQNPMLPDTYGAVVRDLFSWAAAPVAVDLGAIPVALLRGLGALASLAGLLFLAKRPAGMFMVVGALGLTVHAAEITLTRALERSSLDHRIATIDLSHAARVESGADARRSLDGLQNCFLRHWLWVEEAHELDEETLARSAFFVTVAPKRPYSEAEVDQIVEYMQNGGFVLACAGFTEKEGLDPLLGRLGIDVLPNPIGSIPLHREPHRVRTRVEYIEAWPVVLDDRKREEHPLVYDAFRGIPLSVFVREGKGGLFFVGDSAFFGAENLEAIEEFSEPNILFVRGLLDDLMDMQRGES